MKQKTYDKLMYVGNYLFFWCIIIIFLIVAINITEKAMVDCNSQVCEILILPLLVIGILCALVVVVNNYANSTFGEY